MAEKSPAPAESSKEINNIPPVSANEFVSNIRQERQSLQEQLAETEARDTTHGLAEVGEAYELQRKRNIHALEGKLLELDQVWHDSGGGEIDALEAELKEAAQGRSDIKRRILRAQEAVYQNYLEETDQAQTEARVGNEEKERPATATERNLGETAATAAGVADPSEKTPTEPVETSAPDKDVPKKNEEEPTSRDAFYDRELEWMEAVEASSAKVTEDSKKRGYTAIWKRLMDSGLSEEDALRALNRARNAVIRKESSVGSARETRATDTTVSPEADSTPSAAGETEVTSVDLAAEFRKIADLPNLGERMKANLKLRNYLMEKEGKTPEEAAALMDEARNTARDTEVIAEPEGTEEEASDPSVDETAPDSPEDLPTDEELADHEEMGKQLREAGALKQPSARSIRRSMRKMRKKKAYQESYDMGFKTEGERMKKEKELYAKYRNDYFTAKGVKNSLLNRLRYRRGRDVK